MTQELTTNLYSKVTSDATLIGKMNRLITSATSRLKEAKQVAGASAIMHAMEFGNATPMTSFMNACGTTDRNDAIVKWACDNGPFDWKKEVIVNEEGTPVTKAQFKMNNDKKNALLAKFNTKEEMIKHLVDNPFWLYVPQKEVPEFDLIKAMHALVNKAKGIAKDEARKAKSNLTGLGELETLVSRFEGHKT